MLSKVLLLLPAVAVAFQGPALASKTGALSAASKSMPFMEAPPALDGSMAGDVGFDPLSLSEVFDLKWLREAEIKHGRVTMVRSLFSSVPTFAQTCFAHVVSCVARVAGIRGDGPRHHFAR